ncbi:MAG: histidine phosphatase family protein [Dehalococcoidia bacterium]|nr:histidine phosphatase family protein [Dehalococcoidia bacterium]
MRLLLLRHGQTDWNLVPRFQGHTDTELNETGYTQAAALARALARQTIGAVYASPLKRAFVTASLVAAAHGLTVQPDPGLKELHHGDLEGHGPDELRLRWGDVMNRWYSGDVAMRLPGGESMQDLQERAWVAIQRIVTAHPDGTVAAVSHNLAILSIVSRALNLPLEHFRRLRCDTASISVIEFTPDRTVLTRFNDISHHSP